jgi:hypothetical protein
MRYSITCTVNFEDGNERDYAFPTRLSARELVNKFTEVVVMSEQLPLVTSMVFTVVRHVERDEMADFDADMEKDEFEDGEDLIKKLMKG